MLLTGSTPQGLELLQGTSWWYIVDMLREAREVKDVLNEKGELGPECSSKGRGKPVRKLIHVALTVIPATTISP